LKAASSNSATGNSSNNKNDNEYWNGSYADIWELFFRYYQSLEADATALARREKGETDAKPGIFYIEELHHLFTDQKETLFVSFEHVNDAISLGLQLGNYSMQECSKMLQALVKAILFEPDRARMTAAMAAHKILSEMHHDYAKEIEKTFRVEFVNIGIHYEIPEINHTLIDQIISIEGFVTRVDDAQEGLVIETRWMCVNEHEMIVAGDDRPSKCMYCNKGNLTEIVGKRIMNTFQEFELQQRYDRVNDGRMAVPITIMLLGRDAVHSVKGGDFIEVNGIVRARKINSKSKLSRYMFYIEASSVTQKNDDMFMNIFQRKTAFLEEQVKRAIRADFEKEDYQKCVQSVAPSVYGHNVIKEALFLQMIGCHPITMPDGTKFRGDITIFLCGDPATGKSALARAAMPIYRRSVYVNGEQVTKVGLTASITKRDEISRLEAGAYLMARNGIVVIDEFQLLEKQERGALLEVMDDSQSISIMKGGSRTAKPMKANCATLALANPLEGKWDRLKNIYQNTGLRPENVSRFDAIFIFTDTPDSSDDVAKAEHWLKNLANGVAQEDYESGGDEYIRRIQEIESEGKIHTLQYMAYLVRFIKNEIVPKIKPKIGDPVVQKLMEYYLRMRKIDGNLFVQTRDEERLGKEPTKIPAVGMRQLGSLMRFACASAAAHFRTFLTEDDANIAINIMNLSLTSSGFTAENTKESKVNTARNLAARLSLSDMDILRRAEQNHKVYVREWTKKLTKFESLIKHYGFKHCSDCWHTGQQTAGDGSKFTCQYCGGYGGFKQEISINDITATLMTEGWSPREIANAIADFKKVRALEPNPRNPMWLQLVGEWYSAFVKTHTWVDSVLMNREEEQQYNLEREEAAQSPNGARLTTAFDLSEQPQEGIPTTADSDSEIDLSQEYVKTDPSVMEEYEQILSSVEGEDLEETGEEEDAGSEPEAETEEPSKSKKNAKI